MKHAERYYLSIMLSFQENYIATSQRNNTAAWLTNSANLPSEVNRYPYTQEIHCLYGTRSSLLCSGELIPALRHIIQPTLSHNSSYGPFFYPNSYVWSRDSAVGIETSYRMDDREVGVRVSEGSRIFSSSLHPDRLWGPPSLLSNGYRG
jgi:hypothetical protein